MTPSRAHRSGRPALEEKTDEAPANADPGIGYIFEHTRGKKCLLFVNSRLRDGGMLMEQDGLQGFRRNLQDAGGTLHKTLLLGLGYIAVPVPDRDVRFGAQVIEPDELVVDQCLQR